MFHLLPILRFSMQHFTWVTFSIGFVLMTDTSVNLIEHCELFAETFGKPFDWSAEVILPFAMYVDIRDMWDKRLANMPSFWIVYSTTMAFWFWNRARLSIFTLRTDVWEPVATQNWRAHLNSFGLKDLSSSSKSSKVVCSVRQENWLFLDGAQPIS